MLWAEAFWPAAFLVLAGFTAYGATGLSSHGWRGLGRSGPGYCSSHVVIRQLKLGQLGPHRVPALDAHGRQDDLPGAGFHVKVFRGTHGLRHALGQRELVFGSDFGKHGICRKVRIPYFNQIHELRQVMKEIGL
jgi:hypothetical protein